MGTSEPPVIPSLLCLSFRASHELSLMDHFTACTAPHEGLDHSSIDMWIMFPGDLRIPGGAFAETGFFEDQSD